VLLRVIGLEFPEISCADHEPRRIWTMAKKKKKKKM